MAREPQELETVRSWLGHDLGLILGLLLGIGMFLFGAVNWNSWCRPSFPEKTVLESEMRYNARVEEYHRKMGEVGTEAVVPWVWAVPLTVVGLVGAGISGSVLLNRHTT